MWSRIPHELQQQIKSALLQVLASDDKQTMKNAGTCLAIVAAIEVPDGKWDQFLNSMAENATSENYQYRLASIQTLGFLCEFLETVKKRLQPTQLGQILHSTILNIDDQHEDLTKISVRALSKILQQTRENFKIKEQRDFIMQGICKGMISKNEDIAEEALGCLNDVPNLGYATLGDYIPRIG